MDSHLGELKQDIVNNTQSFVAGIEKSDIAPANLINQSDNSSRGSDGKKSTGSSLDDDWLVHVDDTKITEQAIDDFGEFLTATKDEIGGGFEDLARKCEDFQNREKFGHEMISKMTNQLINNERESSKSFGNTKAADYSIKANEPTKQPSPSAPSAPSAPVPGDDFEAHGYLDKVQSEQKNAKFYDDFADNDSPSISYNPSPIKKNPITEALKEQDNEKFISSEDLLGDFKDERNATTEITQPTAVPKVSPVSSVVPEKTADLLGDFDAKPEAKLVSSVVPQPVTKPAEKPIAHREPAPVPSSSKLSPTPPAAGGPKILPFEEIFYKYGLDVWFKPERLHPKVESLIYWRDVKKSGIVFGAGLITLLAISCFSVISVFAYLSLLTLAGTVAFRIYKTVLAAVQKTSEGHPFKEYLEFDLTISQERVQQVTSVVVAHVNGFIAELRRLFLVDDLVDSLKFGLILWILTYIGAWFNGMTLVILAFVSLFTLPKIYENNKQSIDAYLDLVRTKVTEISDKIKVAIPIGKKAPIETDKDK